MHTAGAKEIYPENLVMTPFFQDATGAGVYVVFTVKQATKTALAWVFHFQETWKCPLTASIKKPCSCKRPPVKDIKAGMFC